jgi:penicillin V acylase-like amidase (Ntn superfamily)
MRKILIQISFPFLILLFAFTSISRAECTSFCFNTKDILLFGNNLDLHFGEGIIFVNKRNVQKTGFMFDPGLKWVSKYGSIIISNTGREFPARGMNEEGLVIGEMTLRETDYPMPDSRSPVSRLQWVQYLLDNCATIEEVIETNSKIRIAPDEYPSHFLIADNSGNCITMEWLDGRLVYHKGKDLPVAVLTNNKYEEGVKYFTERHFPEFSSDSSNNRFYRAAKMLKNYRASVDNPPLKYAFDILDSVAIAGLTKWSLVFDIKNKIFYFRTNENRDIGFIDFKSVDFSCETPVQTFNIQTRFKGNIGPQLVDYSYKDNYNLIKYVFSIILPDASESEYLMFADYPKTTQCNTNISVNSE